MAQEYIHQLNITEPELDETFTLPAGSATIGRQSGNTLALNHFLVSRRHTLVETTAESCPIMDSGSSNRTKMNGVALAVNTPQLLNNGDKIELEPERHELK